MFRFRFPGPAEIIVGIGGFITLRRSFNIEALLIASAMIWAPLCIVDSSGIPKYTQKKSLIELKFLHFLLVLGDDKEEFIHPSK